MPIFTNRRSFLTLSLLTLPLGGAGFWLVLEAGSTRQPEGVVRIMPGPETAASIPSTPAMSSVLVPSASLHKAVLPDPIIEAKLAAMTEADTIASQQRMRERQSYSASSNTRLSEASSKDRAPEGSDMASP